MPEREDETFEGHTEGPLYVDGIAIRKDWNEVDSCIGTAFDTLSGQHTHIALANAKLWAAAPALLKERGKLKAERDRLRQSNAELLGALGALLNTSPFNCPNKTCHNNEPGSLISGTYKRAMCAARDAIAKAEGETK